MKIDVRGSRELQAAIRALKQSNTQVRKDINATVRRDIGGRWKAELAERASTRLEQRVILKGARVRAGNDRFSLIAASSNKALRNGLVPSKEWAGAEFGATKHRQKVQTKSRKGTPYTATKIVNRQFRSRTRNGRIAYDAASEIGTWAVAQWVKLIVDGFARAGRKT